SPAAPCRCSRSAAPVPTTRSWPTSPNRATSRPPSAASSTDPPVPGGVGARPLPGEVFEQGDGVVVLFIARRIHQRGVLHAAQFAVQRFQAVGVVAERLEITLAEPGPARRVVAEPLAQPLAGRDLLHPGVGGQRLL